MAGKRTRIKQTEVKHITVPRFEGLNLDAMLEWSADKPAVMQALPSVRREREALPRQYIANIIYTIAGEPFKNWVIRLVDTRHEERRRQEGEWRREDDVEDKHKREMRNQEWARAERRGDEKRGEARR